MSDFKRLTNGLALMIAVGVAGVSLGGCANSSEGSLAATSPSYAGIVAKRASTTFSAPESAAALTSRTTLSNLSVISPDLDTKHQTVPPSAETAPIAIAIEHGTPSGTNSVGPLTPVAARSEKLKLPAGSVETLVETAEAIDVPAFTKKIEDAKPPIGWDTFCAQNQGVCSANRNGLKFGILPGKVSHSWRDEI